MFRWRNFVLLALPIIVLIPLLVWSTVTLYQQTLRDVVSERDEQTARAAAAALTEQLNRRADVVRGIAEQAAISDDYDLLLSSIGFIDTEFEYGIAIFDLGGVPLAVRNVLPDDVIDWPFLGSTASPFSALEPNRRAGTQQMRVVATNESVQVVAAFDPTNLANEVLSGVLTQDRPITAFVVDESGQRVCTIGPMDEASLDAEQQFCVSEALAGNSGTIYPSVTGTADAESDETDRVIAFSPIEPVNWALVTEESLEASTNPQLTALLFAPLIVVPVLLVALGAIWFGERQILRPLQQLEQQAAALGKGQFASIENDVGGIVAVRSLQTELAQMARKVERAQSNLRTQVGAITQGQEDERRRLARELHDDTIQSLIALNQRVQLTQLRANGDGTMAQELSGLQQMIEALIDDVRRFTHALRPIGLEDLGLIPALELLVSNTRNGHAIDIELTTVGEPQRLPVSTEFALYRIAQEAVNNVLKHADAEQVLIALRYAAQTVSLIIEDDGVGFLVPSNVAEMATMGQFGLLGIHERAELIGAVVHLDATPGEGTTVSVQVAVTRLVQEDEPLA